MEQWLPIVGFEGYYEVSDHGRIKSLWRRSHLSGGRYRIWPEAIRRQGDHRLGYKIIVLTINGCKTTKLVHPIVLTAFVGPRPKGLVACHNDGDPSNNRLDNLRWDTQSNNILDAVRQGTYNNQNSVKTHCKRGHEFTEENTYFYQGRICRQCRDVRVREWKMKHR